MFAKKNIKDLELGRRYKLVFAGDKPRRTEYQLYSKTSHNNSIDEKYKINEENEENEEKIEQMTYDLSKGIIHDVNEIYDKITFGLPHTSGHYSYNFHIYVSKQDITFSELPEVNEFHNEKHIRIPKLNQFTLKKGDLIPGDTVYIQLQHIAKSTLPKYIDLSKRLKDELSFTVNYVYDLFFKKGGSKKIRRRKSRKSKKQRKSRKSRKSRK
jgi:hypothetical protein